MNIKKLFSIDNTADRQYKYVTLFGVKLFKFRNSSYTYNVLKDVNLKLTFFHKYLQFKQEYGVEISAEACGTGTNFELIKIKLKDLRWQDSKGQLRNIPETVNYKFFESENEKEYQETIIRANIAKGIYSTNTLQRSVERTKALAESIDKYGYDPSKSCVCCKKKWINIKWVAQMCLFIL